jgi:hypothetical protein
MITSYPSNHLSPFKIDKEVALKEIQRSINNWKKKTAKRNLLQKITYISISKKEDEKNSIHWETSKNSKNYFNIHMVWSETILRTIANVPKKQVKIALKGLKKFYSKISSIKPDLSHPDILLCFNQTANNHNLETKKINIRETIEVDILDPFGGVLGEDNKTLFHNLSVDKKEALESLEYSLDYLDQFNMTEKLKDSKFKENPKNFSFYSKKSKSFNVNLIWADKLIKSIRKVDEKKVKYSLISFQRIVKSINIKRPNLNDPIVKLIHTATINKYKLGMKSDKK